MINAVPDGTALMVAGFYGGDSSHLTTNGNSRNAYAYPAGHLCGREESNSHLLVGSQSFYH